MPLLANKRHEKLARLVVKGSTKFDAYRKVYPDSSQSTAYSNAYQVANRPEVANRIDELLEEIPEASIDNVVKSVSKQLKAKKELIYNTKGDSKFVSDNVAISNAQEKLLKLHQAPGFSSNNVSITDNSQHTLNIGTADIERLASILKDLKSIGNYIEQKPEQSGEVIDIECST